MPTGTETLFRDIGAGEGSGEKRERMVSAVRFVMELQVSLSHSCLIAIGDPPGQLLAAVGPESRGPSSGNN
jgi:hypothetical protein